MRPDHGCRLSECRLGILAALGFETCNLNTEDLPAKATEVFGEAHGLTGPTADVDLLIEATGADPVIATYQSIGKIFSRLVVVGVHANPVPINLATLAYSQQEIIGSGGYLPEDVTFVLDLMEANDVDLGSLVTQTYPLEEIVAAIDTASHPERALHVAIRY
jgi:threonine dehydrogenase-like Zn-dependent dehydrogenase